jgi:hypothetical protein
MPIALLTAVQYRVLYKRAPGFLMPRKGEFVCGFLSKRYARRAEK